MARKIEVTTFYQSDEEILTASVKYIDQGSTTEVNMLDLKEIAEDTVAAWVAATLTFTNREFWIHAVQVSQPESGTAAGEGPATWIKTLNADPGNGSEPPAPDIYTVNVQLSGLNAALETVIGGYRLSFLRVAALDCNVIDDADLSQFDSALDDVFPDVWSPIGGTYERMVEHNPSVGPQENVIAATQNLVNRVGIRRNRIGNVTPYKISPAVP